MKVRVEVELETSNIFDNTTFKEIKKRILRENSYEKDKH